MKISSDVKLGYDDVLIVPQRSTLSSRAQVDLQREFKFYYSNKTWKGIPICAANMGAIGTFAMALELLQYKMVTVLHKYYTLEELSVFCLKYLSLSDLDYVWFSIGYSEEDLCKIRRLSEQFVFVPNIVVDVPCAYLECIVKFCQNVRDVFPDSIIFAGNVCTPEMVQELIISGKMDGVKIGIGVGSACMTTKVTGVGYPQFSSTIECAHVAHGLKSGNKKIGLVISDGGCRTSGDIAKSICVGSDFVMLGGMFAGCEECDGEWTYEYYNGVMFAGEKLWGPTPLINPNAEVRKKSLKMYGMSSHYAQEKHGNGKKDYRASEGKVEEVPYKGPIKDVVQEILGGLRSCGTYIGAESIKDFSKCAQFIRVAH